VPDDSGQAKKVADDIGALVNGGGRVGMRHDADPQTDARTLAVASRALRDDFREKIVGSTAAATGYAG
jgi:hypothetical protein